MQVVAHTHVDTRQFSHDLLECARDSFKDECASVITLSGPLGAGKTALVKHLAVLLGISDPVVSPTFILRSDYDTTDPLFTHLIHIDAYRLSPDEVATIGWFDIIKQPSTLIAVEWPENISEHIPLEVIAVKVDVADTIHTFSLST